MFKVFIGIIGITLIKMGILMLLWEWFARIKFPRLHVLGIGILAGIMIFFTMDRYHYNYNETDAIWLTLFIPYLIVWTVIFKIKQRRERHNETKKNKES